MVLPLLWPSSCKIHWHLLSFYSPWCPCSTSYSFSRQHWVPLLSYFGLGNPLPQSVWTPVCSWEQQHWTSPGHLFKMPVLRYHLWHPESGLGGEVRPTQLFQWYPRWLLHTLKFEKHYFWHLLLPVEPTDKDLALLGGSWEPWQLSPIPAIWVRICLSSGFPGGSYAHLGLRRTGQDPGFLPTLMTDMFLFPLWIPSTSPKGKYISKALAQILNPGCKWESPGEL